MPERRLVECLPTIEHLRKKQEMYQLAVCGHLPWIVKQAVVDNGIL